MSIGNDLSLAQPLKPVGPGFVAAYMAAQVGAYIAFIPLLTLLLPLKVEAIDLAGRAQLLAQIALYGAVTAGAANVLAGWVGDRTRHWPGGRSIWIATGLVGTVFSYVLIYKAMKPQGLIVAIISLQISLNFMLNPLAATLAQAVPGQQRGLVAGFTGLAFPLSSLFGALVIGVWLTSEPVRLTTVVVVTVLMVLPFILNGCLGQRHERSVRRPTASLSALADRDFLIAFLSRLLVQTAVSLNVLYLLFFLGQETGINTVFPDLRPAAVLGGLLTLSTTLSVIAGLTGGRMSDRIGRRRILTFSGALLLAVGTFVMVVWPTWPGPVMAQAILGLGIGLYAITEMALIAEVLPAPDQAGRDMGLMNVAVTGSQILGPAAGLIALEWGSGLRTIYLMGAVLALVGAFLILLIRRVA